MTMKKLLLALALVALLGSVGFGLSTSTAQASAIHYCTLEDNGMTETMNLNDDMVLDLGSGYNWTVTVTNPYGRPPVLEMLWWRNGNRSWGWFIAIGRGQATINAVGTPKCESPCPLPSKQYTLTVVVQ
jgi:hypothetical protein